MPAYWDVHGDIHDGDLLFFRGTSLYARLIKPWTYSVYSHVAVCLWASIGGLERLCVLEALEGMGVRLVPLDHYVQECADRGITVEWFAIDDDRIDRGQVVRYCMGVWGQRYSAWWEMVLHFGCFTRCLAKRLGIKPAQNPARKFCSFVAGAALLTAGYKPERYGPDARYPAWMDPGTVSRFTCLRNKGPLTLSRR